MPNRSIRVGIRNLRTAKESGLWVECDAQGRLTRWGAQALLSFGAALYARGWDGTEMHVFELEERKSGDE